MRRNLLKSVVAWLSLAAAFSFATNCDAAVPRYDLAILTALSPDPASSLPNAINASGEIVGYSDVFVNFAYLGVRAAKWSSPSSVASLGALVSYPDGYSVSIAQDVNNSGLIVGSTRDGNEVVSLFRDSAAYWLPGGTLPNPLQPVAGYGEISFASANGVNEQGNIVGSASTSPGRLLALRWESPDVPPTVLADGEVEGELLSAVGAADINNSGWIVGDGYLNFDVFKSRPMAWDPAGAAYPLPMPLNVEPEQARAYVSDINDWNEVIGYGIAPGSDGATQDLVGLRWSSVTAVPQVLEFFDLPIGEVRNLPISINRAGLVVGYAVSFVNAGAGDSSALLWDQQNSAYELSALVNDLRGWNLLTANSISDQGWIVGVAENSEGLQAGYLLIPVPEPATAGMLCLLLIAVSMHPRIRRRISTS